MGGAGDLRPGRHFRAHEVQGQYLPLEEGRRWAEHPHHAGYRPVFYFRTCDVTGSIDTMASSDGNEVQMGMPGDDITINCELLAATPIEKGMRFAMREGGKTIG